VDNYTIYKYIRLSLDDLHTDSMSIENQRKIIDKHIEGLMIPEAEVAEIVDNGYSGTNFERPGISELLDFVRSGKVNCIIVKDFSRFGRNVIETGYFIERVFPLFRVRFISVSDQFDSTDYEGNTGGMEVAFKFLIHEYYSKDLSKKIKSAKQARMKRGEYLMKNCIYGYRKVGSTLEIDEAAADTIRCIFQLYANGMSIVDIQRQFYTEKRLTPAEYKRSLNHKTVSESPTFVWNKSHIIKVLSDEQYTGTYNAGRTKTIEVGNRRPVRVDPDEWIRIPDHHPAIIDKGLFDTVQARISEKKGPNRHRKIGTWERYEGVYSSPISGKVFCGCCGRKLRLSSTRNPAFHCDYSRIATDAECHGLKILSAELEASLFEILTKQVLIILNTDLGDISECYYKWEQQVEYEKQKNSVHDKKQALYESLIVGEISEGEYRTAKSGLDGEMAHINRLFGIIEYEAKQKAELLKRRQIADEITSESGLTKPMADFLIEKIIVSPNNEIEIEWKNPLFHA